MAGTKHRDVVERLYHQLTDRTLEDDAVAMKRDDRSWRWISDHLASEHDIAVTDVTLIRWYGDSVKADAERAA